MLTALLDLPRRLARLGRRRCRSCKVGSDGRCTWCGARARFVPHRARPIEVAGPVEVSTGRPCPVCRLPVRSVDTDSTGPRRLIDLAPCGHVLAEVDPNARRCEAHDPDHRPMPRCVLAAGHRQRAHEIVTPA